MPLSAALAGTVVPRWAKTAAAPGPESRPRPEATAPTYAMQEQIRTPVPRTIGLFDDVLTTGAHFRAASNILKAAYPGVRIIGLFIARRVAEAVDLDDIEL